MKITLLQTDIIWGQPEANLAHLDHLLEGVGECDLIVLPEMFTTGFDTNPETVADDEGLALKWMRNTVRQRNCALAGSVATKVGENYYNRMYFVSPDLLLASYDKHHLFTYGHEQEAFTPGHRRVVIPYRGARILLQVCYDLRFPVFSRNRGDYDLAIYVANWPQGRQKVWDTLLSARLCRRRQPRGLGCQWPVCWRIQAGGPLRRDHRQGRRGRGEYRDGRDRPRSPEGFPQGVPRPRRCRPV